MSCYQVHCCAVSIICLLTLLELCSALLVLQCIFAPAVAVAYGALLSHNLLFTGNTAAASAATVLSHPAGVWTLDNQPDLGTPEVCLCPSVHKLCQYISVLLF